ncbi:MAG TPA: hypothetical protein VGV64_00515 [Thermoplasmata archaeon]|nr:hypothetical protein [Thermoplasmata archaeon]
MTTFWVVLLWIAAGTSGLLAGIGLNKAAVELPAGRRLGSVEFARFSRQADLGNGLILYPIVGLAAPALTIAAGVDLAYAHAFPAAALVLALSAAGFGLLHLGTTAVAAPQMVRIGRLGDERAALDRAYERFRAWNLARSLAGLGMFFLTLAALGVVVGG